MSNLNLLRNKPTHSPWSPGDGLTGDLRSTHTMRYLTLLGNEEEQRESAWVTGETARICLGGGGFQLFSGSCARLDTRVLCSHVSWALECCAHP